MPECQTILLFPRGQYCRNGIKNLLLQGVNSPEWGVSFAGTGGQYGPEYTFQTAVRRFYFSSQRFDIEDKVIDLMIAFEALFLTENVELSFKLSLRVARFLADEYDSSRLYDIMRKAYSLRSKFVHGDGLKPAEEQNNLKNLEIKVLIKDLSEMLQLSIRKYVRDFSKVSVSDFIKSIDDKIISGQ